jgi:hypothetical protein
MEVKQSRKRPGGPWLASARAPQRRLKSFKYIHSGLAKNRWLAELVNANTPTVNTGIHPMVFPSTGSGNTRDARLGYFVSR